MLLIASSGRPDTSHRQENAERRAEQKQVLGLEWQWQDSVIRLDQIGLDLWNPVLGIQVLVQQGGVVVWVALELLTLWLGDLSVRVGKEVDRVVRGEQVVDDDGA